jgi:transcriptional regulator with XRE-family HTH domain
MLHPSKQCNESTHEVDVNTPAPLYRLVSAELLRMLMQRTGTGAPVSVRALARKAGVPHGTIGNLLTGDQESVSAAAAHEIAQAIGVDVLILFIPMERAEASTADRPRLAVTA